MVFQEFEVGSLPLADAGKVYACATYPPQGDIVQAGFSNRFEGHCPPKNAKSEPQKIMSDMDYERPVVENVESEEAEKQEKDDHQPSIFRIH